MQRDFFFQLFDDIFFTVVCSYVPPTHTPECGYGFRTRLRTRTQVRVRKRYGVRVKVEFVVRKWYGVREVFENGVRVRVRVKSGQKSWCV